MIGQIIQSYLVSLGVQVDKPGFQQADQTIKQTGENVERITGGMARNFVKASTIIASAIASVTASAVGLMKAAAQEDLAMQKYARTMMMSEDAAWKMKKATDALGESINDIALTPELLGRFTQLTADGSKMQVGGDFKQTMKDFRDLMFEFTRLKQEASYALNWVGYYLMKYLQKPLADIKENFKTFNDTVIKGMSVWTEKVARAIYYVIEVGRHLIEFLGDIGKAVYKLWDSFPSGVKKAIAAITALNLVLSAGSLGRSIMLISTLLLLIDDYYGYMEGKNAAFGKYWDKLNEYLDKGKVLWEQLKTKAEPYWNMLVDYAGRAKAWFDELVDGAGELKKSFDEWMDSTGNELLADFVEECQSLWGILTDVGNTIKDTLLDAWKGLWEQLEKNGTLDDLRKNFERVWRIVKMVYQAGKDLINFFLRLWRELEKSEEVREFDAAIMELFDAVTELFGAIMEVVETALRAFFGEFNKTDKVTSFRDVLRSVAKALAIMARGISSVIRWLTKLFQKVAHNKTFIDFWKKVADAIDTVVKKCGKLGRAFGALLDGDPRKAWKILQSLGDDEGKEAGSGSRSPSDLSLEEKLWEPLIQKYSKQYGVDPNFVRAIMKKESNFRQFDEDGNVLESSAGALGLMQVMPDTAKDIASRLGESIDLKDPEQNIKAGVWYIKWLMDNFSGGDLALAAKMYNAGPGAPQNAVADYEPDVMSYYQDYKDRTVKQVGGSSAGEVIAANAEAAVGEEVKFYNPNAGTTIQCDSFTAHIYNEGGIKTIGGDSTDSMAGGIINDEAFDKIGAFHPIGDGYEPQNGDLVAYNRSSTSGHYGIYANGNVISRDSSGVVRSRTLEEWERDFGLTGYGSLAEAEAYRKGGIQQTAYTTGKANVVPLGMANANSMIPAPYGDREATQADLDSLNDPRLVKAGAPTFRNVVTEINRAAQGVAQMLPTDTISKLADSLPDLRGCFNDLVELGQKGLPIFEQMQSGFNPADIINNIGGGKSVDIKIDMGGITVNGASNPEATGRAVLKHIDQDIQFIAANRLGGNHGLVSI